MTPMMQLFTAMWNHSETPDDERTIDDVMKLYIDLEYDALKSAWMAERKVTETTEQEFETYYHETYERQ